MASIHQIAIGADTKPFEQGIRGGLIKPVEEAEKAIEDLGSGGARDLGKLEDKMRDVQRQSEKVGDTGGTSLGKIGEKGTEVSNELRQNLGETFSSFRGDLTDLPQIAQDTLGGLAGSGALGGIPGLLLTVAGAAGFGLLQQAFQNISESEQQAAQDAADWAQAFIDSGSSVASAAVVAGKIVDIATDPDKFKEAQANAKAWGVSVQTAVGAMSGNAGDMAVVRQAVEDLGTAYEEAAKKSKAIDENGNVNGPLLQQEQAARNAQGAWDKLTKAQETGARQAQVASDALLSLLRSSGTATKEVDELGDALYTLPDKTQILVDAKTGQATTDISRFKGDLDGKIPTVKTVDIRTNVDRSAFDKLLADVRRANPVLAVQIAGNGSRKIL